MKSALIFVFVCLIAVSSNAQKEFNRKDNKLKGNVKTVTENSYNAVEKFGKLTKGDIITNKQLCYKYDKAGKLIEEDYYNSDKNGSGKKCYKIYIYNSKGQIQEAYVYNIERPVTDNGSYRDDTETQHLLNEHLVSKSVYTLNSQGKIIEEAIYGPGGELQGKNINKTNAQGKTIEEAEYNANGALKKTYTYKYNSAGKKIQSECSDKNGLKQIEKYDANGNNTEHILEYNGSAIGSEKHKFDGSGNLTEVIATTFDGIEANVVYKYVMDKQGNYINKTSEKQTSLNGRNGQSNQEIVERTLEYY